MLAYARVAMVIALLIVIAGCAAETALPTVSRVPGGPEILCTPAKMTPFRILVAPDESPPAWGEWQAGGRFEIVWPPGFRLRLDGATPVIIDETGDVVAVTGELIEDAGGSGGDPVTICSINGRTYPLS